MRKPKQPGSAPHTHGWALGVQGQLMLFLCGITVLTLGLVWGLITYGLQPMYNRNIQKRLERESSVIAGMIDSAGGQISSRDYGSLTLQNETFWSNLKTALKNGVINVDNCCIDISDNTCRSVQFLEGLYPCILHNSMATFGDNMTVYTRNIQKRLERESSVIAGMIDSAGGQISSRDYGSLTLQNETFWSNLKTALKNGVINVDNCCIDISDNTCRSVQFLEGLYPCILHNSMATFGDNMTVYTPDTRTAILARHALYNEGSLYKIIESGGNRQMLVGCLTKDGSYGVIVSASLAQIETAAEVMRSVLIPVAIFLIALNLLVAALFSRWFTRPMRQLSEGAREIADGNYDVQVPVVRNDELGLLGREFNHMAQEVKRSAQLEKDILANVSHDLRTPLTLIKGYAETVRDITGDDKAKRTEQCSIIVDETDRLSALVNSVMELSKVSSGAEKLNPVDFDMSQLCFEVAGRYDAVCEQNGWTLQLEANKECMVRADPAMMERVLHNLLGNATHHMGADGVFVLRAIPMPNGGCRVEVEDHGPGILPEELPHLFDRYYRARQDAGKTGTGLGLSITKAILQQHDFPFGVNSTVGKGSTFWFEMKAPQ